MKAVDHRSVALSVLDAVRSSNALATAALRKELDRRHIDPRTSAGANRLALGVLRERSFLDWCLQQSVDRKLPGNDARLMDLLRIGAYELLFMGGTPGYATVDSTVDLVKRTKGKRVSGFVNAVLRRTLKSIPDLLGRRESLPDEMRFSIPGWMLAEARQAFGERTGDELTTLNRPASIALRVHTGRITPEQLKAELESAGLHPTAVPALPAALVLAPEEPPYRTLPFVQGLFWPQDLASQLVTSLAASARPARILDACAGLGTKTLQLALDRTDAQTVVCTDLSERRIDSLRGRLAQLDIPGIESRVADMTAPPEDLGLFDLVLLDAPCSGLGTLRRHPELKWRRTKADCRDSAALQYALLEATAHLVAPGGALLYTVCSFTHAEGPGVVARFLKTHPEFSQLPLPDGFPAGPAATGPGHLIAPSLMDSDCFYLAWLVRE